VFRHVLYAVAFATLTAGVWAQDTTATSVHHHYPSYNTEVRNAKVVYVEGNDLVLKLENGKVEHLIVPDSDRFLVDGKNISIADLTPGTSLTQTITTTRTPRYVKTVRILKGKVWHVSAPNNVILTLPDNTNQAYTIPSHAKITLNGKKATAFDLRKGMMLEARIVTDEPQTVVTQSKSVIGQAPAPATPPMVGVLLIQPLRLSAVPASTSAETQAPVTVASEESPAALPKTGSSVPLVGLLGLVAVAMSLGLGAVRKTFNV
jgi:LPXTG-motif cell wall-anchored protein